ncbi:RNA recognition motif protein 2-like protein [Dinothrombium tinctorium]|uniref:RNA-binding protein 42 n=1 Tax=Dinothrombium tinctorium TaxID=1965070 RepID=A0A3S3PKA6_9ACAR|nr:RNA recognition motif protein 2-like protein [Dinothrombium tinctorium]RWS03026.1 RNA recognition motif protein 2-like protein [Dinothrombium tinctorium]RWS08583.1 RNA recognition motif protein 2-like protein [Dinothrombium tinctorium]
MDYQMSRIEEERKRREMEAEMNRFEQEISAPVYNNPSQLESLPSSYEPLPRGGHLFIPHQLQRQLPSAGKSSSTTQSYNSVPPPTVNYTVTPIGLPPSSSITTVVATTGPSTSGKKHSKSGDGSSKKKKKMRMAGGVIWEDPSLLEWDSDDFRLFCGDLGNDVTDEVLNRAFNKYPSFLKAKVIRDKRTNKTKGYGFVSFKDPQDFIRAMREMNGK